MLRSAASRPPAFSSARTVLIPALLLASAAALAPGRAAAQAIPGPDPLAFEWQFEAPDARSRAMGGAYTAAAEGAAAVWWNPASLPGTGRLYQMPLSRYEPVPEGTFGSALYTLAGNFGTRTWGAGATVERYSRQGINPATGGQEPPTEETLLVMGGGVDVLRMLWGGSDRYRWNVGSNFKFFHVKWGNRADGDKWDMDLSTTMEYRSHGYDRVAPGAWRLRFGLHHRNIFYHRVNFQGVVLTDAGQNILNQEDRASGFFGGPRFGLAWDTRLASLRPFGASVDWTWTADLELFREYTVRSNGSFKKDGYWNFGQEIRRTGMELCFAEWVSVRGGVSNDTERSRTDWSYGVGFGPSPRGFRRYGGELAWASSPKRLGGGDDERVQHIQLEAWLRI